MTLYYEAINRMPLADAVCPNLLSQPLHTHALLWRIPACAGLHPLHTIYFFFGRLEPT